MKAEIYKFADFELDSAKRALLKNGDVISLNPKAFDLLVCLVESQGEVVSKDDLINIVWEGQFVEENNITVQVSTLRKVLGDNAKSARFLKTIPGKGYKFVAEVELENDEITFERHSVERIFIDEEILEESDLQNPLLPPAKSQNSNLLYFGLCLLFISIIGSGFWIYRSSSTGKENKPKQNFVFRNYATNGIPQRVTISPDGKSLAYNIYQKGLISVWLGDLTTGNNIQLVEPSERAVSRINFGPKGEYVYFVSRDENHPDWTLMRVSTFGGAVEDLIDAVHGSVTFSPDGKKVAFVRRGNEETDEIIIADVEAKGKVEVLQTFERSQAKVGSAVSWSPDGKHLATFLSEKNEGVKLTLINIENGERQTIGDKNWNGSANVSWLNDGSGFVIVNADERGHLGNSQIWLVEYPQGDIKQLTDDLVNYSDFSLGVSNDNKVSLLTFRMDPQIWVSPTIEEFSDDRKLLAGAKARAVGVLGLAIASDGKVLFTARTGKSQNIWEINQDGSEQKQITTNQPNSQDSQISVTPDNRFLIFQSNRSGKSEIWRSNRDGSNLTQLTNGGGNEHPTLTPDGKWVVYTSHRNDSSTIWRISVEGGDPQKITDEQTDWASVSPDGKYIAARFTRKRFLEGLPQIAVYPFEDGKPTKIITLQRGNILYNRFRWSPDGNAFLIKDSRQGFWHYDLSEEKLEEVDLTEDFRINHFAFSPDGSQFVYSGGLQIHEIVILENFR